MFSFSKCVRPFYLCVALLLAACNDSSVVLPDRLLPDGSRYQGELKDGLLHGEGTLSLVNGEVYQGEFKAGRYHGEGKLSYQDGSVYEGEFEQGVFAGKGRYSRDESWYEGMFVDGELVGEAEYLDYAGNKYQGEVSGWYANGKGVMTSKDGSVFKGSFANGSLEGDGEATYADGSSYNGGFQYNEFDGKGVLTRADKSVYQGEFSYGQYHGQGTLTKPKPDSDEVDIQKGKWRRGKLIFNELTGEHTFDQAELALERHQLLLNTHLLNLKPSAREQANVYFLGVAGDGTQSVFRREIEYVKNILDQRYALDDRALTLINHHDTADIYPMATRRSIRAAINAIGSKMNTEDDVLFVYLSSHGSKEHELSLDHDSINLPDLPAESLANMFAKTNIKWKVIFVSACYSGGFIPELENETTMVITAADKESTSFGCSEESEMTYFGKALFKEVLANDINLALADAFKKAKKIINKWEEEEELDASNPTLSAPKSIVKKLELLSKGKM